MAKRSRDLWFHPQDVKLVLRLMDPNHVGGVLFPSQGVLTEGEAYGEGSSSRGLMGVKTSRTDV